MEVKDYNAMLDKRFMFFLIKLIHFMISIVLFYMFWLLFRYFTIWPIKDVGFRYNYLVTLGYSGLLILFNRTYNSYLLGYTRIRLLVFYQFLSQLFGIIIIFLAVCMSWAHFQNPVVFLGLLFFQLLLNIAWSYCSTGLYFKIYKPRKTILIYRNKIDKKRFGTIKGKPTERLYKIVEEFQYEGNSFREIKDKLEGFDAVFVAGINSRCRNGILKYCAEKNIPGFFLPHVGDMLMQSAHHIPSFDSPVFYVSRKVVSPEYRIVKRAFDFFAALIGIIILSPIMLVIAVLIRTYDGGPAIYKQVRLTRGGQQFNLYKFRSMRVDAEKESGARLSSGDNDDRITPVGRIIRKCRLDELPQLFNILLGSMSFVGPRPERPEIAKQYYDKFPDFKLRLQVKAGLTGYAQIYGRYNTSPYEKLEFDLLYINHMSVLTDLQMIFATFSILFMPESTEGVKDGQVTAMDYENEAESTENRAETVTK